MTKLFEVNKCDVCGNMTRVVHASGGTWSVAGNPWSSSRIRPLTREKRSTHL